MTERTSLRVLSCVPKQRYHFKDKLQWVRTMAKKHKPELFVLPQEYHGGIQHFFFQEQGTTEKISYTRDEIVEPYLKVAREFHMGIAVGALIDDPELGERRERIYVLDPELGETGFVDKFALPAYDHIDAKGKTRVWPETNLENRAVAFDCMGARITPMFCWEVYSSFMWHAISRAQPDFVLSMIKFGVKGWPIKQKDSDKQSVVAGFGFGGDGGWIERLHMAAKWDLACPVVCSTNSWNLPKKCGALCGTILPFEEHAVESGQYPREARRHSLWVSNGKGDLTDDTVVVDQIDFMYWRLIRDHKFTLNGATGEWPSSEARELTMNWKVRRMERALVGLPKLMAPPTAKPFVKAVPTRTHTQGLFD